MLNVSCCLPDEVGNIATIFSGFTLGLAAQLFNMTTDQILNYNGKIPKEVVIEDKTTIEQMRLIQQLEKKINRLFSG